MVKTKTQLKKEIKEYYAVINKKYKLDYIILYGSYVKGHPRSFSDVDLALISDDFNDDYIKTLKFLSTARMNSDNIIDIEPVIYSTDEYNNTEKGSFLHEIKRTGKVVFRKGRFLI